MLKVRIKIKDRNKTEMSKRIKKKCMHVHVITHMILAHNPLLPSFVFANDSMRDFLNVMFASCLLGVYIYVIECWFLVAAEP